MIKNKYLAGKFDKMSRPKAHRTIIHLKDREYLSPNYIRLTFTASTEDLEIYSTTTVGDNNKIFIVPKAADKVYFADENPDIDPQLIAHRRTYTHMGLDKEKQEMYMEFVAHGTEGPASDFAMNAAIGSPLGLGMKIMESRLVPEAEKYILAGDSTALPVIKSILQSLSDDSNAEAFIEIPSEEEKNLIPQTQNTKIHWIINPNSGQNTMLADKLIEEVDKMQFSSSKFAFVACEYSSVKKLRTYFRKEKEWDRTELNAYSYWKYGEAESKSEVERRKEKMEIN